MPGSRYPQSDEPYAPLVPKVRHVWVEAPGGHGPPAPGLVLSWRIERQPSSLAVGWSAQVAVVWALDRLSIEWVGAERLRPAGETPAVTPPTSRVSNPGGRRAGGTP